MTPTDIAVGDGTLSGMVKACRLLLKGGTVAQAAVAAGVSDRTLRTWRASAHWPQVKMLVESEVRDELLGASLEVLRKKVVEDGCDKTATFLVKLLLVDMERTGGGRPSRGAQAGVKGQADVPTGLTSEQALAMLEEAEG